MACLTPLTLVNHDRKPGEEFTYRVPCGKCPACLRTRQSGWTFRLEQEKKRSSTAAFITYTYDEKNLPYTKDGRPTLRKKDLQNFHKRLRKDISKTEKPQIKYYACGEYGSHTQRPHYHSITFNLPPIYFRRAGVRLLDLWRHGHIRIDEVNEATIAYVTKYITKQLKFKDDSDETRQPEFSLMSKKMGANYLTKNIVDYYSEHELPYLIKEGGVKQIMPRYYKDKIYTEDQRERIAEKSLKHIEENPQFESERDEIEWKKQQFRLRDRAARRQRDKI